MLWGREPSFTPSSTPTLLWKAQKQTCGVSCRRPFKHPDIPTHLRCGVSPGRAGPCAPGTLPSQWRACQQKDLHKTEASSSWEESKGQEEATNKHQRLEASSGWGESKGHEDTQHSAMTTCKRVRASARERGREGGREGEGETHHVAELRNRVEMTPVAMRVQSDTVFTVSYMISQHSCSKENRCKEHTIKYAGTLYQTQSSSSPALVKGSAMRLNQTQDSSYLPAHSCTS
eukprot:970523-Pelagomonas_calceolata.AAC.3